MNNFEKSTASPTTPGNKRRRVRVRLETVTDARKEVAKLYRMAREGELDIADASRLANMLALISRMIEGSNFEARIEALEAR